MQRGMVTIILYPTSERRILVLKNNYEITLNLGLVIYFWDVMATKPICKLWNYVIQFSSITLQATVIPSFHFLPPKFVLLGDFLDLKDLITSSQYKEKREMESYLALVTFSVQAITALRSQHRLWLLTVCSIVTCTPSL